MIQAGEVTFPPPAISVSAAPQKPAAAKHGSQPGQPDEADVQGEGRNVAIDFEDVVQRNMT
ncbi:hypothetical protein A6767_22030 [Aeromonas veronii]|nr:hypothetical protein A6767_22030 [Aeromonas veronii]